MSEPTTLRAGDSAAWTRDDLTDYPAGAGWALKYRLLWATGASVDLTASPSASGYAVSLAAADTAVWPAGPATLAAWVERDTERVTLGQQAITLLPDLAAASIYDGRSQARIALDATRAALAAYLTGGRAHVAEYEIAGRRMKFRSVLEMQELIAYYEREVARETAAAALLSGGSPGRVRVRM